MTTPKSDWTPFCYLDDPQANGRSWLPGMGFNLSEHLADRMMTGGVAAGRSMAMVRKVARVGEHGEEVEKASPERGTLRETKPYVP